MVARGVKVGVGQGRAGSWRRGFPTHVEDIVGVVERRLLVVKGREAHALKVPPVALLAAHHDPHRAPLRNVHGLDLAGGKRAGAAGGGARGAGRRRAAASSLLLLLLLLPPKTSPSTGSR